MILKRRKVNRALFGKLNLISLLWVLVLAQACTTGKNLSTSSSENLSRKEKKAKLEQVIDTARTFIGTPYRYGGTSKAGMDCSGLLLVSFNSAGLSIPRTTEGQAKMGKNINMNSLKPGDLVFFAATKKGRRKKSVTHVGLVTSVKGGDVLFIHSSTSKGVREDQLFSDYWKNIFIKASRPF